MKIISLIILTILTISLNVAAQKKEDFIGYKHKGVVFGKTLPNGFKDLGGGLLSDENYGVTRYSKNNKNYLWLEKINGRDSKGVPTWTVKDVLIFGSLKKNEEFLFSYSSPCKEKGRASLELIVLAEFLPVTKNYKVVKAWKADIKKEKFEVISTENIKC